MSPFRGRLWLAYTSSNGLQLWFLFQLPPFKWLSRRPSPLSVMPFTTPFTTTLHSVRVSKRNRKSPAVAPLHVFYFLRGFGYAYLQQYVPIVIAALASKVFLRYGVRNHILSVKSGGR